MTRRDCQRCMKLFYNQGDSYYTKKDGDKCIVGYSNDYPLQHGDGRWVEISLATESPVRWSNGWSAVDKERFRKILIKKMTP